MLTFRCVDSFPLWRKFCPCCFRWFCKLMKRLGFRFSVFRSLRTIWQVWSLVSRCFAAWGMRRIFLQIKSEIVQWEDSTYHPAAHRWVMGSEEVRWRKKMLVFRDQLLKSLWGAAAGIWSCSWTWGWIWMDQMQDFIPWCRNTSRLHRYPLNSTLLRTCGASQPSLG